MAEVARKHEWPTPKSWTWTKILSPNIRYFVALLRTVAINALFGIDFRQKSVFFCGQIQSLLGKKYIITDIVCIA